LVCWNFIENPANKSLVDKQTFEGQEIAYIDEKLHFTFLSKIGLMASECSFQRSLNFKEGTTSRHK